jgi:hypothetical protein
MEAQTAGEASREQNKQKEKKREKNERRKKMEKRILWPFHTAIHTFVSITRIFFFM